MLRAWDKEKIRIPDRIRQTNTGRRSIHLSYKELMESEAIY